MRTFSNLMDRFRRDERGNIVMIFAIALVPLLTFMGAAIDYSRTMRARATMQSVLDSVSLMVAKDLSSGLITNTQVNSKAQSYFTALYTDIEAQAVQVSATYTQASGSNPSTILVNGSASVKTNFMQLLGFNQLAFKAASTSTWGANLLRVALVLDNTGSMASNGKMDALQPAAKSLVTQLSALAQKPGDVYISVVPFEVNVNVGSFNGVSNTNASWLRWDQWDPKNTNSRGASYCSDPYGWLARAECVGHGYTWGNGSPSTTKSLWNGCVSDRDKNYDLSATVPTSQVTNFPANQEGNCPAAPVLPLTYNWTTINSTIDLMSPSGATNQTIGLQWGWLSLLQQSPMNAPAEDPNYKYQDIIILFTDGLNTADRWYGDGSNTSTQVDSRMKTLCDNIKATGVTIYTVQIDTTGKDGVSSVLPYCASGPGNFFMLNSASQISSAFAAIGTSIAELRVAK